MHFQLPMTSEYSVYLSLLSWMGIRLILGKSAKSKKTLLFHLMAEVGRSLLLLCFA